ncbi:BTAD domain-containing putative transcriptional regulator [Streptomyces gelaticus]|uniref:AfsR/SARP family transcriptional regulator n=1 Tax=Streptomyces gelaticus TaxID=285446 RepID=UPI0037925F91
MNADGWAPDAPGGVPVSGAGMTYRILGPLEITTPAGTLSLASSRRKAMLAALLLEANRPVSVDRLMEAVWDVKAPATARSQLHICVSQARKELSAIGLPDALATRAPGYLMAVGEGELDLHVFERRVRDARRAAAEGHPHDAAALYTHALSLWRGTPLPDVNSALVRSCAERLAGRRLGVLEERIACELRLGRHKMLVEELEALVDEYPIREPLQAMLMTALNGSGRRAEALEIYRRARNRLVEELGIEPGEELRALHQTILRDDGPSTAAPRTPSRTASPSSSPAAVSPVAPPVAPPVTPVPAAPRPVEPHDSLPRQLPAPVADFTRQGQVDALVSELTASTGTDSPAVPRTIVVSGRGGVGKTAFALQTAHALARAHPDGQLYAELSDADGRPVDPAEVLRRFLRALGTAPASVPEDLLERAELYRSTLAGRRVLVVLDGVVDDEQVSRLLPAPADCTALLTSRDPLPWVLGTHAIRLDPMTNDQAVAMLGSVIGTARVHDEPVSAAELVRLCGGLPLALRIAGARLRARPHWSLGQLVERLSDESRRLDELEHARESVRDRIGVSYAGLDPELRRLFARLALLRIDDFPAWLAAPLADTDLTTGTDMLDELVQAQLVDIRRTPQGSRYHLHKLFRLFAREQLAAAEPAERWADTLQRVVSTLVSHARTAACRPAGGRVHTMPTAAVQERSILLSAAEQALAVGASEEFWDLTKEGFRLFETARPVTGPVPVGLHMTA